MSSPGYKRLLEKLLPLALVGAGEDEAALLLCQEVDVMLRAAMERQKQRQREAYAANPEPVKQRVKERRNEKPVDPAARRAQYQARHAFRLEKGRQHSAARKASGKAAAYREQNREAQRAASRARASNVTDGYARELLAKNSPVSAKDFPQRLVEVKKLEIQLKRAIRHEQRY